jgi:hypothetical protein
MASAILQSSRNTSVARAIVALVRNGIEQYRHRQEPLHRWIDAHRAG